MTAGVLPSDVAVRPSVIHTSAVVSASRSAPMTLRINRIGDGAGCLLCEVELGSGVPRNFVRGGVKNSVEDRGQTERGCGGDSPLVRGSGGSRNLVQEISFHIVKFS